MTNVRIAKTLTVVSLLLLAITSPVVAQPPEGFAVYEDLKEQFVLSLPLGWSAFNQQEILTGNVGKVGPVVFCSETIDPTAMLSQDHKALEKVMDQLVRTEVGLIAGFLLDRLPAKKGMSCKGFTMKAQKEVLKLVGTDPMFGRGRSTRVKPRAEAVTIGTCQGLRIKGKGEASTGAGKMLDIFAVSDGDFLYLFKLLNLEEHYTNNVGVFEEVLSTLTLTASPTRDFVPYERLKEQLVLSLPIGWSVYNHQEILEGDPGKLGTVGFCSETIDLKAMLSGEDGAAEKVGRQLTRTELGIIAGFQLDRLPAKKGTSCEGFDKNAQKEVLKLVGTDPMFGPGRKTRKKPRAEVVAIGGCQGLRIKGKGEASSGAGKILDIFAVSDGDYVYLFKLLNLEEHYAKNVGVFEDVVSTVTLAVNTKE